MSIIRINRPDRFLILPQSTALDSDLTLEARGLLTWLLAHPDGWEVRPHHIQNTFNIGKDKWQRIARELEDAGYLRRWHEAGAGGRRQWKSEIFAERQAAPAAAAATEVVSTGAGFSGAGLAGDGATGAGEPCSLLRTEEKQNTELTKTPTTTTTTPRPHRGEEAGAKAPVGGSGGGDGESVLDSLIIPPQLQGARSQVEKVLQGLDRAQAQLVLDSYGAAAAEAAAGLRPRINSPIRWLRTLATAAATGDLDPVPGTEWAQRGRVLAPTPVQAYAGQLSPSQMGRMRLYEFARKNNGVNGVTALYDFAHQAAQDESLVGRHPKPKKNTGTAAILRLAHRIGAGRDVEVGE